MGKDDEYHARIAADVKNRLDKLIAGYQDRLVDAINDHRYNRGERDGFRIASVLFRSELSMLGIANVSAIEPLTDRLGRATAGSCNCNTKTPDVQFHDAMCYYRLFCEARDEIERAAGLLAEAKNE